MRRLQLRGQNGTDSRGEVYGSLKRVVRNVEKLFRSESTVDATAIQKVSNSYFLRI